MTSSTPSKKSQSIVIPLPQDQATKPQINLIEDLVFTKLGLRHNPEFKITWVEILDALNTTFHTKFNDINELDKKQASYFIHELKQLP
jgi:hypothetical protein